MPNMTRLCACVAGLVGSLGSACAQAPTSLQDAWFAMASANVVSPAPIQTGDVSMHWYAPDNRLVQVTIKVPHPSSAAPTVTMGAVAPSADAGPAFAAALQQVKQQHAKLLVIPRGTYTFYGVDPTGLGHIVMSGLTDVTIEGSGATFIFMNNVAGIYMSQSQRVTLRDITIQYGFRTATLGTVQSVGGQEVLVIDPAYPVGPTDGIGHIAQYDRTQQRFVPGGQTVYLPANLQYLGNQTYSSTSFNNPALLGQSFVVFEHYYGGTAVLVADSPGPSENADISIAHVTINSAPGMGIVGYGIKRGFMIADSQVTPLAGALISTEYDAIHVIQAGGDVAIVSNLLSGQGDDGINLNSPVHPIVAIDQTGQNLTLSTYSRFIQPGDTLAFFDANDAYQGSSVVASTKALGGLNYAVVLQNSVAGVTTQSVARDVALIDGRVVVTDNAIGNCQCHGMLVQTPNTYVANNILQYTSDVGIELLTNTGNFLEGVGAINVSVAGNVLNNTGMNANNLLPWAAISTYGPTSAGIAPMPVNHSIQIKGNIINAPFQQGCIMIASSDQVNLSKNICNAANQGQSLGSSSIDVVASNAVTMVANQRFQQSTGGIFVDSLTTNTSPQQHY